MMADYTLTISNLINTKYVDTDQDVAEHVAKLKQYRRDLILMNRNLPDEVFACFLRLSMPSEWNYGLSDPYMSKKVEARIKGKQSNWIAQSATATAYCTSNQSKRPVTSRARIALIAISQATGLWHAGRNLVEWKGKAHRNAERRRGETKRTKLQQQTVILTWKMIVRSHLWQTWPDDLPALPTVG